MAKITLSLVVFSFLYLFQVIAGKAPFQRISQLVFICFFASFEINNSVERSDDGKEPKRKFVPRHHACGHTGGCNDNANVIPVMGPAYYSSSNAGSVPVTGVSPPPAPSAADLAAVTTEETQCKAHPIGWGYCPSDEGMNMERYYFDVNKGDCAQVKEDCTCIKSRNNFPSYSACINACYYLSNLYLNPPPITPPPLPQEPASVQHAHPVVGMITHSHPLSEAEHDHDELPILGYGTHLHQLHHEAPPNAFLFNPAQFPFNLAMSPEPTYYNYQTSNRQGNDVYDRTPTAYYDNHDHHQHQHHHHYPYHHHSDDYQFDEGFPIFPSGAI